MTAIVPLGAGSASDLIARVVMEQVGRQLGQPVVVENRPGAGGTIGANAVAKSATDGYTVLVYGALNTAHALYSKLPYETFADFIPVTSLGQQPLVIVTSPAKGFKTLAEMIAAGKSETRLAELFVRRGRLGLAFRRRAAAHDRGLRGAAYSVQGRRRSGDRCGCGPFGFQRATDCDYAAADPRRQARSAGGQPHKRVSSLPDVPTTIETGLPPKFRLSVLYGRLFAGGNTAARSSTSSIARSSRRWKRPRCRRVSRSSASSRCP